jgi:RimJ/RimL family protein N-acetyltransferase
MPSADLRPQLDSLLFERSFETGSFGLRPLRVPEDIDTIHAWVSQPHARYWGLCGQSRERVLAAYHEIVESARVYLGYHQGVPHFLVECYDPAGHAVSRHYPVEPGDRGMHLLVAPPSAVTRGFTWSVFRLVMDFLFADPATRRVVVEPDIRNTKIHDLNGRGGCRYKKAIALRGKTGLLAL